MKKIISILMICSLATSLLVAMDFSFGIGQLYEQSFRNGSWVKGDIYVDEDTTVHVDMYEGFRKTSNGLFLFFDAKYAMLDVSYARAHVSGVWKDAPLVLGALPTEDGVWLMGKMDHLTFSLLGKYPIDMGAFSVFPLLGVNYNYILTYEDAFGDDWLEKNESTHKPADLSQFGILGGLGADYDLSESFYLRCQALFNLRFPSSMANDTADLVEEIPGWSADNTLGATYRIQLGLGYRF